MTTHTQQYWSNDQQGTIYCSDHAGSYLYHAIQSKPKARRHRTPLGDWSLMTEAEVIEFLQFLNDEMGITTDSICESCRDHHSPQHSLSTHNYL